MNGTEWSPEEEAMLSILTVLFPVATPSAIGDIWVKGDPATTRTANQIAQHIYYNRRNGKETPTKKVIMAVTG